MSWNPLDYTYSLTPLGKGVAATVGGAAAVAIGNKVASVVDDYVNVPSAPKSSGGKGGGRSAGKTARTNRSDLRLLPANNFRIPKKVPNVATKLVWGIFKQDQNAINAVTTGIIETNYYFQLNNLPQYSLWCALFDQYCIVQASVTFPCGTGTGLSVYNSNFHTAIDFDNTTNLSSVQLLDNYATSQVDIMTPGKTVTRSVRPCVKGTIASVNLASVVRTWIDTTQSGIPHYGIRTIWETAGSTAETMIPVQTVWVAFRNQN